MPWAGLPGTGWGWVSANPTVTPWGWSDSILAEVREGQPTSSWAKIRGQGGGEARSSPAPSSLCCPDPLRAARPQLPTSSPASSPRKSSKAERSLRKLGQACRAEGPPLRAGWALSAASTSPPGVTPGDSDPGRGHLSIAHPGPRLRCQLWKLLDCCQLQHGAGGTGKPHRLAPPPAHRLGCASPWRRTCVQTDRTTSARTHTHRVTTERHVACTCTRWHKGHTGVCTQAWTCTLYPQTHKTCLHCACVLTQGLHEHMGVCT